MRLPITLLPATITKYSETVPLFTVYDMDLDFYLFMVVVPDSVNTDKYLCNGVRITNTGLEDLLHSKKSLQEIFTEFSKNNGAFELESDLKFDSSDMEAMPTDFTSEFLNTI